MGISLCSVRSTLTHTHPSDSVVIVRWHASRQALAACTHYHPYHHHSIPFKPVPSPPQDATGLCPLIGEGVGDMFVIWLRAQTGLDGNDVVLESSR